MIQIKSNNGRAVMNLSKGLEKGSAAVHTGYRSAWLALITVILPVVLSALAWQWAGDMVTDRLSLMGTSSPGYALLVLPIAGFALSIVGFWRMPRWWKLLPAAAALWSALATAGVWFSLGWLAWHF